MRGLQTYLAAFFFLFGAFCGTSVSAATAGLTTPGIPDGLNSALRNLRSDKLLIDAEANFSCGVIDNALGVALFATNSAPSLIVKVTLGSANAPSTRIGSIPLNFGEDHVLCAVYDPVTGVALFGTSTSPGRVIKVAMNGASGAPVQIGTLLLNPTEGHLRSAVFDSVTSTALFATDDSPGKIVKVGLGAAAAAPTRVGTVVLNAGEVLPLAATIDSTRGVALFGCQTSPGTVVKINLNAAGAAPTRVGAVPFTSGPDFPMCAAMDTATGTAIFGCATTPGAVAKVNVGAVGVGPTYVGSTTMSAGENVLLSVAYDSATGVALFGTQNNPGIVVKVNIGPAGNTVTRVGSIVGNTNETSFQCALMDPASKTALFGGVFNSIVKFAEGPAGPTRVGALVTPAGESQIACSVYDPATHMALLGTGDSPAKIVKVQFDPLFNSVVRVGALTLNTGENVATGAAYDPANGVALFGLNTSPSQAVKVAMNGPGALPTRIGVAQFVGNELVPGPGVFDAASNSVLFATQVNFPAYIVKFAMNAPAAAPTRVGSLQLVEPGAPRSGVLDVANSVALFAVDSAPSVIVKMGFGTAGNPPVRVGALTLNAGENSVGCAAVDPITRVALFGSLSPTSPVIKVALNAANALPTRVGAITLPANESVLKCAAIDSNAGVALFGTLTQPGVVVKVALGSAAAAPARLGSLTLNPGQDSLSSIILNPSNYRAFITPSVGPNAMLPTVAYSQFGVVTLTKVALADNANVSDVRLYSHAASGNVRMAIYDAAGSNVLWQSGVIPVTQANAEIVVPVSSGTPAALILPSGTVYVAFQTDTNLPLASFTAGAPGDGLEISSPFGAFPTIPANAAAPSSNKATEYFNYAAAPGLTITSFSSNDNPGLIGTPTEYDFNVFSPTGGLINYTFNWGDGSALVTGSFQQGTSVSINYTYPAPGKFPVVLTVTDGRETANANATEVIPSPSSLGFGIKNVSDGGGPVTDPVTGVGLQVSNSNGGVVQLGVTLQNPDGTPWTGVTHFNDTPGNPTDVPGIRPVHAFATHGIWVAQGTALDSNGTPYAAARKMLLLSAKETGEIFSFANPRGRVLSDPPNSALVTKGVRGRFVFSASSPDNVLYSGTFMLPGGLDTSKEHELSFGVGNIVVNTKISTRGKATPTDNSGFLKSMKVHFKVKRGAITQGGEIAQINAIIKSAGLVAAGFDTEGITNHANDVSAGGKTGRSIQVALLLAGVPYQGITPVDYSIAKNNQFGTIGGRHN